MSRVGTYGAHRIKAELRYGKSNHAGHNQIARIMRDLGLHGTRTAGWRRVRTTEEQRHVISFTEPFDASGRTSCG